jgi:hypothetical protein
MEPIQAKARDLINMEVASISRHSSRKVQINTLLAHRRINFRHSIRTSIPHNKALISTHHHLVKAISNTRLIQDKARVNIRLISMGILHRRPGVLLAPLKCTGLVRVKYSRVNLRIRLEDIRLSHPTEDRRIPAMASLPLRPLINFRPNKAAILVGLPTKGHLRQHGGELIRGCLGY